MSTFVFYERSFKKIITFLVWIGWVFLMCKTNLSNLTLHQWMAKLSQRDVTQLHSHEEIQTQKSLNNLEKINFHFYRCESHILGSISSTRALWVSYRTRVDFFFYLSAKWIIAIGYVWKTMDGCDLKISWLTIKL